MNGSAAAPKVSGVVETCLHVKDVELSARFYEALFGFRRMISDARFCAFDAGPHSVFLLFLEGGTLEPVTLPGGVIPPHDGSGHLHVAFGISLEEIPAWEARLSNLGIAVESRVNWELGGHSIYFRDPDLHLIELITPGVWLSY